MNKKLSMGKENFEMEIRKEYQNLHGKIIRRIEDFKGLEKEEASQILLRVSREERERLVAESMTIGLRLEDILNEQIR